MKQPFSLLVTLLLLVLFAPVSRAEPPGIINHQGRIAVSGVNFNGTGHFKFALVRGSGSPSLWSNDGSSSNGSEPTDSVPVPVAKGHYAVALGETNAIPASVFADEEDVRLRVWISATGAGGSFEKLTPDRRIASAGYALTAEVAKRSLAVR